MRFWEVSTAESHVNQSIPIIKLGGVLRTLVFRNRITLLRGASDGNSRTKGHIRVGALSPLVESSLCIKTVQRHGVFKMSKKKKKIYVLRDVSRGEKRDTPVKRQTSDSYTVVSG